MQSHFLLLSTARAEGLIGHSKLLKGGVRNPVPGPAVQQAGPQVPMAHWGQPARLPAAASSLGPGGLWGLVAPGKERGRGAERRKTKKKKNKTEGGKNRNEQVISDPAIQAEYFAPRFINNTVENGKS